MIKKIVKEEFIMDNKFGWTDKESNTLFKEVKKAQNMKKPLNKVFEKIARETNRKANSVRNYYYQQVKVQEKSDITLPNHFISFSDRDIKSLISAMLTEQAKGKSVRKCALDMGDNDKTKMLRYQNKYRSVVKSSPDLVKDVMKSLDKKGIAFINPYQSQKVDTPKKESKRFSDVTDFFRCPSLDCKTCRGWLTYCAVR